MALEVGEIVEAKVSNIMPFGAFVSLPDNKTGLIHISEVASTYVENIHDHIKVGDVVKAKIVKIDENGKISLSIKKAEAPKKAPRPAPEKPSGPIRPAEIDWSKPQEDLSFEDKLSKFKQDSDEKMQALRRSNDSKRSGGYRRGGGNSF
ncbi:MAG: S1 RNA-binding domain-containing protein [Ruminococcaceae bacterium]|nr:S1 RNA-binding domain-containing protein [Oscillospiraceae bacterium]